jgi:hypothetical protein
MNNRKIRVISYQINLPISKIFDSKSSTSALNLIKRDYLPFRENVYLVTGTIWNNGNLPITKKDVRESFSINHNNCKRILDFKLVKQSTPPIAKYSLSKISNNILNIDWTYFDHEYKFDFQTVTMGGDDPDLLLIRKVFDIRSFTKILHSTT